jgi:ABC-2 type transport system ATP-binding protein
MSNQAAAITVDNLHKSFKKVSVLKGVSFSVEKGTIFALLGANGAGKTTVINILTTLQSADSGTATVSGFDVAKHASEVRKSISLTGQFAAVDDVLNARENLVMIGELRHVKNPDDVAKNLLRQFDLEDAADRRVVTFSGGMRRRLDIAMSLIGSPSVIFLDEPTTGLDPQSRNAMWATIKSLAAQGTTVFLTTQYLEEADQLADQVAILSQGKIVASDTPLKLKRLLPHGQIELQFHDEKQLVAAEKLLAARYRTTKEDASLSLTVSTEGTVAELAHLLTRIEAAHIDVAGFVQKTPTLDDAFFEIINQNKEK